jgi:acetyl esterase
MGVDYRLRLVWGLAQALRQRGEDPANWAGLEPPARDLLRQVAAAQSALQAVQPLTEEKIIFARKLMARATARQKYPWPDGVVTRDLYIPGGPATPADSGPPRREMAGPAGEKPDRRGGGSVAERDGAGAGVRIPARVYRPLGPGPFPIHVYFHGGAFIFGRATDPDTDAYLRWRAKDAQAVIVNPDYRLAPEHRFPAGVEDCYAAVVWARDHAADISGDPDRLSVGGASSGGNMAAAVALMARDRGGPTLNLQLLEIPGTDLRKTSAAWYDETAIRDTTREADLALIAFYLAEPADSESPYASPLLAPDVSGVAPAYVMSAEHDPRREESEAYVSRLEAAGVTATARTLAGHVHGSYALWPAWEPARAWRDEANRVLKAANEGSWP